MKSRSSKLIISLASLAAMSIAVALVAQQGTATEATPTLGDSYGSGMDLALLTNTPKGALLNASTSGTPPTVHLSTTSLVFFGYPHRCKQPTPEPVVMTNLGPSTLNISSIGVSRPFAATTTCGTTLAAGNSCTITVTWNETYAMGQLAIYDNGVGSPQKVRLTGLVQCLS